MEGKEYYEDDDERRNSDSSDNNDNESDEFGLPDLENADDAYSDKDEDSYEDSSDDDYSYASNTDDDYLESSSDYGYYDDENTSYGDEPEEVTNEHYVHGLDDEESGGPGAGVIVLIIVLVLAIAGGAFWYFYWKDRNEPVAQQPDPKPETIVKDTSATEPAEPQEPIIKDEPEPSTTTAGQVNVLDSRTGRYYVVVASFIDDDLARDYADKLAKDGTGATILTPNREPGFYRLAIADFASLNDAAVKSEQLKSTYGNDVWVLKY